MTRFKEWLTNEAGHFSYDGEVTVVRGGKPITLDVDGIDPRFEMQNIPNPENPTKKFLGQKTFSLPVVGGWLVSKRLGMLGGSAKLKTKPEGIQIPSDWANKAQFALRTPAAARKR